MKYHTSYIEYALFFPFECLNIYSIIFTVCVLVYMYKGMCVCVKEKSQASDDLNIPFYTEKKEKRENKTNLY